MTSNPFNATIHNFHAMFKDSTTNNSGKVHFSQYTEPKNNNDSSEHNINLSDTYKDYNKGNPKKNSNVYTQLSDREEEENLRKYLSIPTKPKSQTNDKIMNTQTAKKRIAYKKYNIPSIMGKHTHTHTHTTQKCLPSSN